MKRFVIILALGAFIFTSCGSSNANNNNKTAEETTGIEQTGVAVADKSETLTVQGLCDMCKERIETTAKAVSGVKTAEWSSESKILKVSFDDTKTSINDISKAIAKVGHDTDKDQADEEIYKALPGCCQYR